MHAFKGRTHLKFKAADSSGLAVNAQFIERSLQALWQLAVPSGRICCRGGGQGAERVCYFLALNLDQSPPTFKHVGELLQGCRITFCGHCLGCFVAGNPGIKLRCQHRGWLLNLVQALAGFARLKRRAAVAKQVLSVLAGDKV
ncbi:MAG: hypothetical protein RR907_06655 [Comamonas sp.]